MKKSTKIGRYQVTTAEFRIMDAGIATEDNLKFLKENGYDWICISKKARVAPPDREPDSTLHTRAKHLVEEWRISDEDADELKLYARSD